MTACKLGLLLDPAGPLDTEDRATLTSAATGDLAPRVPAAMLANVLRRIGHPVGPTTVKDHRAGRCACGAEQ